MSLVTQAKFDELVANTTRYLQDTINRVQRLEEAIKELQSAPKPAPRSRKGTADDDA